MKSRSTWIAVVSITAILGVVALDAYFKMVDLEKISEKALDSIIIIAVAAKAKQVLEGLTNKDAQAVQDPPKPNL